MRFERLLCEYSSLWTQGEYLSPSDAQTTSLGSELRLLDLAPDFASNVVSLLLSRLSLRAVAVGQHFPPLMYNRDSNP